MKKDKHGNECTKRLSLAIYTLAQVKFEYFKALEFAEKLYGKHGILFDVVAQQCLALKKADQVKLAVIDGTCKWDQNNSEQDDLWELVKPPVGRLVVFIVGGIQKPKGPSAGCAGHAPSKPAVVVSGSLGTNFTLAHEVGHVLLTSDFTPVHTFSKRNIMVNGTHKIPKKSFPDFNRKQLKQIMKSKLLVSI